MKNCVLAKKRCYVFTNAPEADSRLTFGTQFVVVVPPPPSPPLHIPLPPIPGFVQADKHESQAGCCSFTSRGAHVNAARQPCARWIWEMKETPSLTPVEWKMNGPKMRGVHLTSSTELWRANMLGCISSKRNIRKVLKSAVWFRLLFLARILSLLSKLLYFHYQLY